MEKEQRLALELKIESLRKFSKVSDYKFNEAVRVYWDRKKRQRERIEEKIELGMLSGTDAYDRRARGREWREGAASFKIVSGSTSPNPLRRKGFKR